MSASSEFVDNLSWRDHKSNVITQFLEIKDKNAHQPKTCRQSSQGHFKRCLSTGNRRFESALLSSAVMHWHDRQADGICFLVYTKSLMHTTDILFPLLLL